MKDLLFWLVAVCNLVQGAEFVKVVPGKSIGDIHIGNSSAELRKNGFVVDDTRAGANADTTYLKKEKFLARLNKDSVVQIWYEGPLENLTFKGKPLPSSQDIDKLMVFFGGCEEFLGSGGKLVYCDHRGCEISTSLSHNGAVGFSVILPSEVGAIVGRAKGQQ